MSVTDIANHVGVSPRYLQRIFADEFQLTIKD
ncbi:AraC family transcriptional regulator [Hafnia paralvei]